jgi:hypothetical protein
VEQVKLLPRKKQQLVIEFLDAIISTEKPSTARTGKPLTLRAGVPL